MVWRVGVDIGGTFTDVALIDDASGEIGVAKVPTTPRDLAEGVLAALRMAMDRHKVKRGDVGLLSHATTVVTNAILEGQGARAAQLLHLRGDLNSDCKGLSTSPRFCFRATQDRG